MITVEQYRRKCVTAEEAVKAIKSNQVVFIEGDTGLPQRLVDAMVARAPKLRNVKTLHLMVVGGKMSYLEPGLEESFRHIAFFTGGGAREAINEGRAEFIPIFLSDIADLFYTGAVPIDVALIHVSLPDEHGFCSYGVSVDITKPAAENAEVVIAQVNPNMPRSLGDSFVHLSKIDYVVEVDDPIPELVPKPFSEVHRKIGKHISTLIEDGTTLQMGIGAIPDAVLSFLGDKKDLGVHTEMFSDGVMDLIDRGIITNEKKTLHQGKIIAAFFMGTKKLYDYVDNNPIFEFHPCHYTNDPFVISQNEKMVAINSAIEVDLTGQVCSDSIGYEIYSGIGGQVDFIRGAARSKGGKAIIALPSTAKGDSISRIVPHLKEGAGVVTSRGDVHYIVTEYGIAYLHGRSISERAKALIDIAHPNFREELEQFAQQRNWL